jgi:hypothetical protein
MISVDPTGTGSLRSAFNSLMAIRWRGARVLVRRAVVDQDYLSLGGKGLMAIGNPAIQGGATKTQMFQRWFDYMLGQQVLASDGSFMREYIEKGYNAGRAFAQTEVGGYTSRFEGDRKATLFQLAVVELQGIIEAVSQKAVRAVASGILHGLRPARIARDVQRAIDTVALPRTTALVELITVKAFGEATLDVYESAGVRRVGLVPETLLVPSRDARSRRITPSGRAGSRSRRGEAPGIRTIQRIKQHERGVERIVAGGLVRVKTAGDKRVCKVCRGIAKRGPYRINKARALIPAHPRCRCVFVPVVTKERVADTIRKMENGKYRLYSMSGKNLGTFESLEAAKKHEREVEFFKHRDEGEGNPNHDPETGRFTSGEGGIGGQPGMHDLGPIVKSEEGLDFHEAPDHNREAVMFGREQPVKLRSYNVSKHGKKVGSIRETVVQRNERQSSKIAGGRNEVVEWKVTAIKPDGTLYSYRETTRKKAVASLAKRS